MKPARPQSGRESTVNNWRAPTPQCTQCKGGRYLTTALSEERAYVGKGWEHQLYTHFFGILIYFTFAGKPCDDLRYSQIQMRRLLIWPGIVAS